MLGWNQSQMGAALDQTRESIGAVERGVNHSFRGDKLANLIEFCGYRDDKELWKAVRASSFPDLPAIRARREELARASTVRFPPDPTAAIVAGLLNFAAAHAEAQDRIAGYLSKGQLMIIADAMRRALDT